MYKTKQDKFIEFLVTLTIVLCCLLILLVGFYYEGTYKTKATVYSTTEDTVTFEEEGTGYLWEAKATETESIKKGDRYRLTFDTNGTEGFGKRFDDGIIGFKRIPSHQEYKRRIKTALFFWTLSVFFLVPILENHRYSYH